MSTLKQFNKLYNSFIAESTFNESNFFQTYDEYGPEHKILCRRIGKPRKAVQMKEAGEVETREGKGTYEAGDWLLSDEQGGQYPVKEADFPKLYDAEHPLEDDFYNPKPQERTFFRTDKKIDIETEWGDYVASPGDYVQIYRDGSYGCPVKPDAMQTGYVILKKL